MKNKKYFLFIFTVLWLLVFISPVYAGKTVVKLEVDKNYPPFSYTSDGRIYGFSIDLANILFEPDKFDIKLSSDEWHRVYEKLVKGQVDVVVPVAVLEERKDYIYYSKPILTRHVGLYTKKGFSKNVSLKI